MKILGIETSCDETAASVVTDNKEILSNIVLSQLKEHEAFGGVVPEIAARAHLNHIDKVILAAIKDADIDISDLDVVAATSGPGLIGGVMIGMMAGKTIAASQNIPFIAVNHLEGHILTPRLTDEIKFPYLILLASGGHTQILVAESLGNYKKYGTTIDDAIGEAFDKSAKMMGLEYPGGPNLEKIAFECTNHEEALKRFPLPRPMRKRKNMDFSLSGLKTAVRNQIDKLEGDELNRNDVAALAYSFQIAVAEVIEDRMENAISKFTSDYKDQFKETPTLIVAGGVAANKTIRKCLTGLAKKHNMRFVAPPLHLCTDNGAMIAWAGMENFKANKTDSLEFKPRPRWPLDEI